MNTMSCMDVYPENGFKNREEYLLSLADQFGVSVYEVKEISSFIGECEDFDALVILLEDYVNMFCQ